MSLREIPVHPGAPVRREVEERPLRSIEADAISGLEIRFEDSPTVRVEAPKALRVDETGEPRDRGLERRARAAALSRRRAARASRRARPGRTLEA